MNNGVESPKILLTYHMGCGPGCHARLVEGGVLTGEYTIIVL